MKYVTTRFIASQWTYQPIKDNLNATSHKSHFKFHPNYDLVDSYSLNILSISSSWRRDQSRRYIIY